MATPRVKKRKRTIEDKSKTSAKTGKKSKTKAAKSAAPGPPADDTKFPFLKLPAEIRNMVYHYALVDTEYSVRMEANISKIDGRCTVNRLYRAVDGPPDRDDLPGQTKGSIQKATSSFKRDDTFRKPQFSFAVALFQVCRQINAEAASYFYGGNLFVFEAVPHMSAFLMHFHQRIPLLRKLGLGNTVANRGIYRGPKSILDTQLRYIFPWLAGAVELEELHLGAAVLYALSGRGRIAAGVLFEQGFYWMREVGMQRKDKLAVLDVIKLPAVAAGYRWATDASEQAAFKTELTGRLA